MPLWIPYLSLPVGMGLLTLQLAADLLCLVTGRASSFGLPPRDAAGPAGAARAEAAGMAPPATEARP